MDQDSLQDPPEEAPTPKTPPKVMECWSFLHFSHFSNDREKSKQKCSQDPPKSCQTEPKMAILAPSWPILGATCCQLGPSCVHLGPIFAPTSPKISAKSRQKSQEAPPETPRPPTGRQRAPGQPLEPEFSWFRDRFWTSFFNVFCSLSLNSSWPLGLNFKARGGLARAAHWIALSRLHA